LVSEKTAGHQTLFLLSNHCQVNTNKQKIYGCFIDLKKAFDSVWRLGLLYKILQSQNMAHMRY